MIHRLHARCRIPSCALLPPKLLLSPHPLKERSGCSELSCAASAQLWHPLSAWIQQQNRPAGTHLLERLLDLLDGFAPLLAGEEAVLQRWEAVR